MTSCRFGPWGWVAGCVVSVGLASATSPPPEVSTGTDSCFLVLPPQATAKEQARTVATRDLRRMIEVMGPSFASSPRRSIPAGRRARAGGDRLPLLRWPHDARASRGD